MEIKVDEKMGRFKDAPFVTKEPLDIVIGGSGGIGFPTAFCLSRLQHNLHLYEMDTVGPENNASQLFKYSEINKPKDECVKEFLKEYSDLTISTYGEFKEDSFVAPITFSCFDNMKARQMMFNQWKKQEDKLVFIDGRLLAECFQILVVQNIPEQIEKYEKEYLFNDSEVEDLDCTYKSTSHFGLMIGSLITSIFTNWLTNYLLNDDVRLVPFFTEFNGPNLYFNTQY